MNFLLRNTKGQLVKNTVEDLITTLKHKGISSKNVLEAIRKIPRSLFVNPEDTGAAYEDHPLSIGYDQVISQPYLVARMTEELLKGKSMLKVLEIGTGSGYQAAVLSQLVKEIYSIERIKPLYETAKLRLKKLNIKNVRVIYGDGSNGWPEQAPYDGIIVTAAANKAPNALLEQLVDGGKMIIPLGNSYQQNLYVITKKGDLYEEHKFDPVLFVPLLTGKRED